MALHLQDLPQELHDHIIDALKWDKSALKACSLVMRRWLERSRKHIFEETPVIDIGSTFSPGYYDSPDVTKHVRKVRIHGFMRIHFPFGWFTPDPLSPVGTELSHSQLLKRFPWATELELYAIKPSGILSMQDRDAWRATFPAITTLSVISWRIPLHTFLIFLSSFPHLKDITIDDMTLTPTPTPSPSSLVPAPVECGWFPRPQLSRLNLDSLTDLTVGELSRQWLSSASSAFANDFSLSWGCINEWTTSTDCSSELLTALNTAVTSLEVVTRRKRDPGPVQMSLGIEQCTKLRELKLCHQYHHPSEAAYYAESKWIAHALLNIRSQVLRKITIYMIRDTPVNRPQHSASSMLDFASIGRALRKPELAGLTHVDLYIHSTYPEDDLRDIRRRVDQDFKLPSSMQLRILSFDFEDL